MKECAEVEPGFDISDVSEDATTEDILEEMEMSRGSTFRVDGKALKVVTVDKRMSPHDRDALTVTDPTVDDPQDARAGQWGVVPAELYADWRRGNLEPAEIAVETS